MEIKIENNLGFDIVVNVNGGIIDSISDGQVAVVDVNEGDTVGLLHNQG